MSDNKLQSYQEAEFGKHITGSTVYAGELTLEVEANQVTTVLQGLKDQFGFDYLADITGSDFFTAEKRFGLSYNICNLSGKDRIRVNCRVDSKNPKVKTAIPIWKAADWFEREVYDMVGIEFEGHPDLRRIYMPEDFEYFPLRKEFPLIGIPGSIQTPEKDPPKPYK